MDSAKVKVHRIGFTQLSTNHARDNPYKVNIVFVHGLRGHPERTWTSGDEADSQHQSSKPKRRYFPNIFKKESKSSRGIEISSGTSAQRIFWPHDFLIQDLPDARVWTYGYDADVTGGLFQPNNQNSISQHGRDLDTKIRRAIENKEPIVFVAHSLGGLLVKNALGRSEDLCSRTNSILFLGTPHRGSSAAEWGQIAANLASLALQDSNKKILKGLEVNSEVLENIHWNFKNIVFKFNIKIHSFQEGRGIMGMKGLNNKVVSDYSSIVDLPDIFETVQSINANHSEMVKCKSRDDPQYRDISDVLRRIIRDIPLGTVELASEVAPPIHETQNVNNS
ncbi:hypothetical protein F5Y13DRAFT_128814 [Hypoxylon sp. FL1857]|nr:hypothetical protein F5Y13DRAFT_128814 [Hypoxylon sp. FL1857]